MASKRQIILIFNWNAFGSTCRGEDFVSISFQESEEEEDDDDDGDEDYWGDVEDGTTEGNGEVSDLSFFPSGSFAPSDLDTVDEEEDPDAVSVAQGGSGSLGAGS